MNSYKILPEFFNEETIGTVYSTLKTKSSDKIEIQIFDSGLANPIIYSDEQLKVIIDLMNKREEIENLNVVLVGRAVKDQIKHYNEQYGPVFKKRIFLGGTCNESTWRDKLIELLKESGNYSYFNPVVDDWTEECYQKELEERKRCDICLYTITPKMTGVYSIAEVVDDSNKKPQKTVFCVLTKDEVENPGITNTVTFSESQLKSLNKVAEMVKLNGGKALVTDNIENLLQIL